MANPVEQRNAYVLLGILQTRHPNIYRKNWVGAYWTCMRDLVVQNN